MEPSAPSGTTTAIGVDIGGTGIKGAPVDVTAGAFAAERVRILTPSPATPERVTETVGEVLGQLDGSGPIGITMPAVVRAGIVETAANIDAAWIGVDAAEQFGRALGRDVTVMNDADAAGLAEMRFGAGKGHAGSVVVVTLGTGIGSAVFADGAPAPQHRARPPATEGRRRGGLGGRLGARSRGPLVEALGAPPRALLLAARVPPLARADHRGRRREQEGGEVPPPHRHPHPDRRRPTPERSRNHRRRRPRLRH